MKMILRITDLPKEIEGWRIEGEKRKGVVDVRLEEKRVIHLSDSIDVPEIPYRKLEVVFSDRVRSLPLGIPAEVWKALICPALERKGAIPKRALIVGRWYKGECRNADKALWLGERFEYDRYKFGSWFKEKINHYEDDDGYDLFIPLTLI